MTATINGAGRVGRLGVLPGGVPGLDGVDWGLVGELRERVSTRLAAAADLLGAGARRELSRQLIRDEYGQWLVSAARRGTAAPGAAVETRLFAAVLAELDGLGRITPIAARGDVEDIHFEGCDPTVLRLASGEMVSGPPLADTDEDLVRLLRAAGARGGDGQSAREFSSARPVLNVRLRGISELGGRLAAAMDVVPRPAGVIRIHRFSDPSLADLQDLGMVDTPMRLFLGAAVAAGCSILVSGMPGVGKTTCLRALGNAIPFANVVVTVEDERELGLHLPHVDPVSGERAKRFAACVPFESRLANDEGRGGFSMREALDQALRLSPTRTLLGEVRGGYVIHLLDAAVSGVSSIMCTIHSPSAAGIFDKVLLNALKSSPTPSTELVMRSLAGIDLVVHVSRDAGWNRFVSSIHELGHVGDSGRPDFVPVFARSAGRARPAAAGAGRLSEGLAERLADVGFDARRWLDPAVSDWGAVR